MKIANIFPANHVSKSMQRQPVEMYLTHIILENPDHFAFLAEDEANGISSYKILDNSACELGDSLDIDKVLEAAKIIGASEIVLPDRLQKGDSLSKTLRYLSELPEVPYKLMAVAQGENSEEVMRAIEQICMINRIDTIGIPKWYCSLDSTNGLGRHSLTRYAVSIIEGLGVSKQIHWLGCEVGMRELVFSHANAVRSCDTGYFTALCTPLWNNSHYMEDRPKNLKIDLRSMEVCEEKLFYVIEGQNKLLGGLAELYAGEDFRSTLMEALHSEDAQEFSSGYPIGH